MTSRTAALRAKSSRAALPCIPNPPRTAIFMLPPDLQGRWIIQALNRHFVGLSTVFPEGPFPLVPVQGWFRAQLNVVLNRWLRSIGSRKLLKDRFLEGD